METNILIIVFSCFFIAASLKGLTGLGFVTLCLPVISSFIDVSLAIPLVIIPSLTSNVMVIAQTRRFGESIRRFWLLYVAAFPGLYFGVSLLSNTTDDLSRIVLGAVSIMYALFLLLNINFSIGGKYERYFYLPVGLVNGTLNGLTGTQVMPMLPFMISLRLHRDLLINAINLGFTLSMLVLMLFLSKFGMFSLGILKISVLGIIPVTVGIYLGSRLRYLLSDDKYRYAVLIILMLIGVNLILNP
jgi:uncharacterized membrane protein YfcA